MDKLRFICILPFFCIFLAGSGETWKVYDLSCNYLYNPVGIDTKKPILSWKIKSDQNGKSQSAYRIIVIDWGGGIFWDSGKIESDKSILIPYCGKTLESGSSYFWKVKIWDEKGDESNWSSPAYWTTGIMSDYEWKAKWIGTGKKADDPAPFFRKEFNSIKKIAKAYAFISGLGYYELRINGKKIGDSVLDPAQTDYEKRIFYNTYDISRDLQKGMNAVGIILGNGWYNQQVAWGGMSYGAPELIMQIKITYQDGSETIIITDNSWRVNYGPIIYNSVYKGEIYDARSEKKGWDEIKYDDSAWPRAAEVKSPGGVLTAQSFPPEREIERIEPRLLLKKGDSLLVLDLGQNISGYTEISVSGPPGTMIKQRFAETTGKDCMIDVGSTGVMATGSEQTDTYFSGGGNPVKHKPRFTYHGFRFIEVTAKPSVPPGFSLTGIVVHTNVLKAGKFECSDALLNRINQTALWTLRDNMHGLLTDCPHRERCGWLGDAHIACETAIYNMQTADFWIKYIRDIETSLNKGLPTNVAPGLRIKWVGNVDWGAAVVLLPWYVYQYYGDLSVIGEQFQNMKRYVHYLEEIAQDGIVTNGFGDWYDPPAEGADALSIPNPKYTSTGITSTSLYYECLNIMVKVSRLLDYKDDAMHYENLKRQVKESFNRNFFSPDSAYRSQTANVLALRYNLTEDKNRDFVLRTLIDDIEKHDFHFTTGIQGAKHLYNILSDNGYGDIARKILTTKTFPGIPYLFSLGATTNWENWSNTANKRGVPRSKNHPMNTGFATWFYESLAGIKADPSYPAFKRIILQPDFRSGLEWVSASYESPYGEIVSSWKKVDNKILWKISVPVNTTAEINLKPGSLASINSGEKQFISEIEKGRYIICSGHYNFLISGIENRKQKNQY
jgi:alpha-L-rhamnosidase